MNQFDKTTEQKAEQLLKRCRKQAAQDVTGSSATRAGWCKEDFKLGRDSIKGSMETLSEASLMASAPLGLPLNLVLNPNPSEIGKWLNEELKERSDLLRAAIEQVKSNGDWPLEE